MNGFVSNLISRHIETGGNVKPRVRSRFEPMDTAFGMLALNGFFEQDAGDEHEQPPPATDAAPFSNSRRGEAPGHLEDMRLYGNPEREIFPRRKDEPLVASSPMETGAFNTDDQPASDEKKPLKESRPEPARKPEDKPPKKNTAIPAHRISSRPPQPERQLPASEGKTTPAGSESDEPVRPLAAFAKSIYSDGQAIRPALSEARQRAPESRNAKGRPLNLAAEPPWLSDFRQEPHPLSENARPPVVKITIGRIDVRAAAPPPPPPARKREPAKPRMTLEDYLKKQNGDSK